MFLPYIKKCFFGLILLLTVACGNRKLVEKPEKLEHKKTADLISTLDTLSRLRPNTFYTKIKCSFKDTTQSISFKTSIRAIKDSIINPIITFAAIPIVSSIIRKDSVIVSNKKDKCFIKRDVAYIKEAFGVDFNFRNIEEMILGLPVGYDSVQRYFRINDPFHYILSSHKKREIRRENNGRPDREHNGILNRRDDKEEDQNVIIQYFIGKELNCIDRIYIDSPDDTTTINIEYLTRDSVSNYYVPKDVIVNVITPRNHITLEMNYGKVEVNEPQDIYFIIPEDYEECSSK